MSVWGHCPLFDDSFIRLFVLTLDAGALRPSMPKPPHVGISFMWSFCDILKNSRFLIFFMPPSAHGSKFTASSPCDHQIDLQFLSPKVSDFAL
jgi:hypothetical protein